MECRAAGGRRGIRPLVYTPRIYGISHDARMDSQELQVRQFSRAARPGGGGHCPWRAMLAGLGWRWLSSGKEVAAQTKDRYQQILGQITWPDASHARGPVVRGTSFHKIGHGRRHLVVKYLLDSSIIIRLFDVNDSPLLERIAACDEGDVVTSAVAYAEVALGSISGKPPLIAAHALSRDLILVSDNERHFADVPGLRIENWTLPLKAPL